ncbi:MAG: L-seryl-tRNA(Sec) selenium transferase [Acidimicrobiia bacterium]
MELRDLPGVDALVDQLVADPSLASLPAPLVAEVAREAIDRARGLIRDGESPDPAAEAAARLLPLAAMRPRRVVNATGVLLHTNLGRAPISPLGIEGGIAVATGYGNLELDLDTGKRGGRGAYVNRLLTALTGTEAALVVNNNAAGLFLALAAIAGDGSVAVSRGELIEIGGSFRLPELMRATGANLVEVGTTNRTRRSDYERVAPDVAAILKVHPSNYRIEGFAEEVGYTEAAEVASSHGIPLIADIGGGLLDHRTPWLNGPPPTWVASEPGVRMTLEDGAGIVLFSGDKLLGGPQAGVIVGKADLVERMARHPIARAVRTGATTLAMLAATLELYASGRGREVPFWQMASLSVAELDARHRNVLGASGIAGRVVDGESLPGAGTVPGVTIPGPNLELDTPVEASWKALVTAPTPVLARRQGNALRLDLRTVEPDDDGLVIAALAALR